MPESWVPAAIKQQRGTPEFLRGARSCVRNGVRNLQTQGISRTSGPGDPPPQSGSSQAPGKLTSTPIEGVLV